MMTADVLFFLVCSILISHELDAAHKREWRLLYILREMPEEDARSIFILLHVPLITFLIWLATNQNEIIQYWTIAGIDVFAIIHAILHWRLRSHPLNAFNTTVSNLLIYGSTPFAFAHLVFLNNPS